MLLSIVLVVCRVFSVVGFYRAGNPASTFVGHVELLALGLGCLNIATAKMRDSSPEGCGVALLYLFGMWIYPPLPSVSLAAYLVYFAAIALNTWALVHLGNRFSVGGTAWISLCNTGPYRWVRHPQQLARLLAVFAGLLTLPGPGVALRLLLAGAASIAVILCEENTLVKIAEYREYMLRVPHRLLPRIL
jgi:protein-S-isoprenylcysteine O-methyltransferase Ste14